MPRIALVGCGFLGSIFAEELVKKFWAQAEAPLLVVLYDDDIVDDRNPANHNFHPYDIGLPKALALRDKLIAYEGAIVGVRSAVGRVEAGQPLHVPERPDMSYDLIVDAVDNLPTRHALWALGLRGTPVMHLGVSQAGTGCVEWTTVKGDTFSLSPVVLSTITRKAQEALVHLDRLPPCQLVVFRGLGLNMGIAATKAISILYGYEPTWTAPAAFTTWDATTESHHLRGADTLYVE